MCTMCIYVASENVDCLSGSTHFFCSVLPFPVLYFLGISVMMMKSVKARCRGLKCDMPFSFLSFVFFFHLCLFASVVTKRFLRYFSRRGFETHICNLPSHVEALFAVLFSVLIFPVDYKHCSYLFVPVVFFFCPLESCLHCADCEQTVLPWKGVNSFQPFCS